MKCEISSITLFYMRCLIYDKSITQVRGFHERPTWVITWHTHDFCCIIYNFRLTLLHFTIHPREKELNNIFEADDKNPNQWFCFLWAFKSFFILACLPPFHLWRFSLFLSLSLSLSLIVAKHFFEIFWSLFKMKVEGFYFLFLDNVG